MKHTEIKQTDEVLEVRVIDGHSNHTYTFDLGEPKPSLYPVGSYVWRPFWLKRMEKRVHQSIRNGSYYRRF